MTVDPRIDRLRDPMWYIRHVLNVGVIPEAQQRIIRAVRDNQNVAIRACHGIGKTFTMGRIVTWFVPTHPNSKTLTTAPTGRQVNSLLWAEIRAAHQNSRFALGGEILDTPNWKLGPEWFAMGYSPEKEKAAVREGESANSNFQGFHAPDMLIVVDEATGVAANIWSQIDSMATSGNCRIVAIGNPTTKKCEFYKKFSSRSWKTIHLSCFDSPNLGANGLNNIDDLRREVDHLLSLPEDKMRSRIANYRVRNKALVTASWVVTRAMPDEWGIDSIKFQTRVLGEWPEIEDDVFFEEKMIEEACQRQETPKTRQPCRYIGVDPARFGTDSSVITVIEDYTVTTRKELRGKDTSYQAGEITQMLRRLERRPDEKVLVDSTGVGSGVIDQLRQNQQMGLIPESVMLVEIHNGEGPVEDGDLMEKQERDATDYANKKAKIIDLLAKDMAKLAIRVDHEVYKRELPTILYSYDNKGRMRVESKDDYKKRTKLPSPDTSESLAYANYGRHVPTQARGQMPRITAL